MFVRPSKFRHVFGCPFKKEACYEGLKATKSAHDTNFCAVNPLFVAVVVESSGGGSFVVLPIEKTGRVDANVPKVCGHRASITDLKWCPHNDFLIASSSDDTTIKIWSIPDEGLFHNITEPVVDLNSGHHKRVSYIEWHPCARDILLSAGADHKCLVWDVREGTLLKEITTHEDMIFSISWNFDGSLFVTTCKDKMIRIIDPRTGDVVAEGTGHQGNKSSKAVFLNGTQIFTTGFSRSSERQYALWDYINLSKPLKMEEIDASCGTIIPFFDHDLNIVYLAGKGDGNIRYVEISNQPPFVFFLNQFQSSIPQRGLGFMPKRGLDMKKCEIGRFYKLHSTKDICEPISMIVPRKSDNFQPDIYPPTASTQPSTTAEEWWSGVNKPPIFVGLQDGAYLSGSFRTRTKQLHVDNSNQYDETNQNQNKIANRSKSLQRSAPLNVARNNTFTTTQAECNNYITDLSSNDSLKNPLNVVRNNTFSTTTTQGDYSNSLIDLTANNPLRKTHVVRRKRRTRTIQGLDDEPRSSPSSYDDDDNETRDSDLVVKSQIITQNISANNFSTSSDSTKFHMRPFISGITNLQPSSRNINNNDDLPIDENFKVQNVVMLNSSIEASDAVDDSDKYASRAMLDCISVDAPDDGVILPSKLRASMTSRSRKVERSGTVDSSISKRTGQPPNPELKGLIRAGSVREKSRNYNSIMDRNFYKKNEYQHNNDENIDANITSNSNDLTHHIIRPHSLTRSLSKEISDVTSYIDDKPDSIGPQHAKFPVGKSQSTDQVPQTIPLVKTATARVLPIPNITSARKFPGKSLSDFKANEPLKSSCEQNGKRPTTERRSSQQELIERKTAERSEDVVARHNNNNNNYINISMNDKKSPAKADVSMSHTELLQEYVKQQLEIKKLKYLLEQKDLKLKKCEEELQKQKFKNRRMI